MDEVYKYFRELAEEFGTVVITAKAPPLTEAQKQRIKDHRNDPYRFVDYIGLIRP